MNSLPLSTDNGFIEAFDSNLRAECLNAHWFMSLADATEKLGDWRRHYNDDRPHLGYRNMGRRPIETVMSFVGQEG